MALKKQIENATRAFINIPPRHKTSDLIQISGTPTQCQEAADQLRCICEEDRLPIPRSKHGWILGKKGVNKKEIEKETGAWIQVTYCMK